MILCENRSLTVAARGQRFLRGGFFLFGSAAINHQALIFHGYVEQVRHDLSVMPGLPSRAGFGHAQNYCLPSPTKITPIRISASPTNLAFVKGSPKKSLDQNRPQT